MPLLCVGPSVKKFHRRVKIVDMSCKRTDQSMRTTLFFADSREVFSGIVILGIGTLTGFRTKGQDNRPQYLIHVHLNDQVSLYNHQICRPIL